MRDVVEGVRWLEECYDLGNRHEHVSVYLLSNGSRVLIDSGSFYHREAITAQVEAATGGAGVDALVLSHSDYPHSANVREFAAEGSGVELVASSGAPRAQGLPPDARTVEIGGSTEVAGRRLSFIDPPLADRSHTTWIYDHDTRGLFTADGFGSYHRSGECDRLSPEYEGGIPEEAIYDYHADTLVWLRYVDPGKLADALESIFEEYPPDYVAPIHGPPILAADLDRYLERLMESVTRFADGYEAPEA
jgi:flavorubredoxin